MKGHNRPSDSGPGKGSQEHGKAKGIEHKVIPPFKRGDPCPPTQHKFNEHGKTADK